MNKSHRLVDNLIVALAMTALAVPAVAQGEAAPTAEETPAEGQKQKRGKPILERQAGQGQALALGAGRQARDPKSIAAAAWWNDAELVEALSLEPKQRSRMDLRLTRFLDERGQRIEAGKTALKPFLAALEKGDLEAARKAIPSLEAAEASLAREVAELRIDVLAILTAEQRTALGAGHAELLRQDWAMPQRNRRMPMKGPQRGAGQGDEAAKPGGEG